MERCLHINNLITAELSVCGCTRSLDHNNNKTAITKKNCPRVCRARKASISFENGRRCGLFLIYFFVGWLIIKRLWSDWISFPGEKGKGECAHTRRFGVEQEYILHN